MWVLKAEFSPESLAFSSSKEAFCSASKAKVF